MSSPDSRRNNKRTISPTYCCQPQCKKTHRPRRVSHNTVVRFNSCVSMRTYFDEHSSSSWLAKAELDNMKIEAKKLAALHRRQHSASPTPTQATTHLSSTTAEVLTLGDAIRYELDGQSLRGVEYLTDVTTGRKRRNDQGDAVKAVILEQQEQLVQHVLDASFCAGTDAFNSSCMNIDTSKLSKTYGSKTHFSLSYARRVAQEEALIAKQILSEDLEEGKDPTSMPSAPSLQASSTTRSIIGN